MSLSPLSNIHILDFSRILAAPFASMLLSDLGATIWKIEKPGKFFTIDCFEGTGDEVRNCKPPLTPGGDSCYHVVVNRNKMSIAIDLKHPTGNRLVRELASKCDVVIENFKPGVMKKLNLDYETLKQENEQLIYCSITGFGSHGPYANRAGYDIVAEALGGFMHVNAPKNGEPLQAGVPLIDMITGLYAHGAILTGLLQRQISGKGQLIECNLFASQIAALLNAGSNFLNAGLKDPQLAKQHESVLPAQAFRTKCGRHFVVAVDSDHAFKKMCQLMGLPEIAENELYKTTVARIQNQNSLIQILSKRFSEKTLKYWKETLKDESLGCAPVNSLEEAIQDPQVKHLNLVQEMYHHTMGLIRVIGPVVSFSEAVNRIRSPPPALGEHTRQVLQSVLGIGEDELEYLESHRIIQS